MNSKSDQTFNSREFNKKSGDKDPLGLEVSYDVRRKDGGDSKVHRKRSLCMDECRLDVEFPMPNRRIRPRIVQAVMIEVCLR